jgi:hypothetical protein
LDLTMTSGLFRLEMAAVVVIPFTAERASAIVTIEMPRTSAVLRNSRFQLEVQTKGRVAGPSFLARTTLRDESSTSGDVLLVEVLDLRHAGVPLPEELVQFAGPPDG